MSDSLPDTVVVLDVETTGLSPAYGDRVCEIGLVTARGDQVIDTFQSLVNPQRPLSPAAARVNGLSDSMLHDAPVFARLAGTVLDRLDGQVIIGHNVSFDLGFLCSEFSHSGISWKPSRAMDTLKIARQYFSFPSYSLASIAHAMGLDTGNSHRALDDALTTFQVYRRFVHQLRALPAGSTAFPVTVDAYRVTPANEHLPLSIQEAFSSRRDLEIGYVDRDGRETRRQVTPLSVMTARDYVYLVAYCHLRQQERQFRLDRIVDICLLDQ
jgi:DNA polymerase-3 subunit epsilon